MKRILIIFILPIILSEVSVGQALAQWRGAERKGVFEGAGLLKTWPEAGPELIWAKDDLGNGYGSPSIVKDRMYITGEIDSIAYLYCLGLDGKLIWKSDFGKEWVRSFPGSRSAPTVTSDLVYVASGLGNIFCFESLTGKLKWKKNLLVDLHGQYLLHGHAEAILLDNDLLFFTPGGKDTNVVALNRFSGEVVWVCKGLGERAAYNSPVLVQLQDKKLILVFTAYHLLGIDASNGELLLNHEQDNTPMLQRAPGYGDTHSNSVWYEDGTIYYLAGDGNGAVKLQFSADGNHIKQLWRNQSVDNYMGGFIKLGNNIYTTSSSRKELEKLDATTGQITDSLKCGEGSVISADGLLFYYNQRGEILLVNPADNRLQVGGKFKLSRGTKEHFSHPVIDRGIMYVRHGKSLMAYKVE
ncbi:MAG: PQQ-binding-like beta-propeller repeat protein [Bacteroidales bacterium]